MTARPFRLFVAIYPPETDRRAMAEALAGLSPPPHPKHRLVPLEQVHLTIQFIGDTRERELNEVIESVRRSVAGVQPFALTPRRLISLPERGLPRLIAMETDAPAELLEPHSRLSMRLARRPRPKSGDKFLPHLTLCRFGGDARPARVDQPVTLAPFEVGTISLMRSVLHPAGAEHRVILEVPLG